MRSADTLMILARIWSSDGPFAVMAWIASAAAPGGGDVPRAVSACVTSALNVWARPARAVSVRRQPDHRRQSSSAAIFPRARYDPISDVTCSLRQRPFSGAPTAVRREARHARWRCR